MIFTTDGIEELKQSYTETDFAESKALIRAFMDEIYSDPSCIYNTGKKLSDLESGKRIQALRGNALRLVTIQLIYYLTNIETYVQEEKSEKAYMGYQIKFAHYYLLSALLRKKTVFEASDILLMMVLIEKEFSVSFTLLPFLGILRAVELYKDEYGVLPKNIMLSLERLYGLMERAYYAVADHKKLLKRIALLIEEDHTLSVQPGDAWGDRVISDVEEMSAQDKLHWMDFLNFCASATESKPSEKWLAESTPLITNVTIEALRKKMRIWIPLIDLPGTEAHYNGLGESIYILGETNSDILRGLAWLLSGYDDLEDAEILGEMAFLGYKKVDGLGPRSVKIGNAAVYGLGRMNSDESIRQLAKLKTRVTTKVAFNAIEKALKIAAENRGVGEDELEEISLSDFGLQSVGSARYAFDDYSVEVSISGRGKVEVIWTKPDGKLQKSVPAAIKETFASELKDLKKQINDLKNMLSMHKVRIESFYLRERQWNYKQWREYYLDHHFVGAIACRLIWNIDSNGMTEAVVWNGESLEKMSGELLNTVSDNAVVTLWHPISETAEHVNAWRQKLEGLGIAQPFKQAHREVYLLTDAERETSVYSNRFAAHVLRQHQFKALAALRGWNYALHGDWGTFESPFLKLPKQELLVEFWVDPSGSENLLSETGAYLYISTDQVRFYKEGMNEPMALADVPSIIFSEALRDIDLFVGVCSVGNDPEWRDGGSGGGYRDYWNSYSFGELGESAKTRRTVLEHLLPRLKIAERSSLDDRYLIVKGDLRTYKIHLGSGNILMLPNDEYLCIVTAQETVAKGNVFLPFEGDDLLSIILSKAILLAADTKIKDKTIVSQIKK